VLSDGRRLATVASPRARSVTFAGVAARTKGRLTLVGLTRGNAKGPAAHLRLHAARHHRRRAVSR
jgi:hypothetical protein